MPNATKPERRSIRTDRNGVQCCARTIYIPVPTDDKVERKHLGKLLRADGTRCMSMKSVYETLIEKAMK